MAMRMSDGGRWLEELCCVHPFVVCLEANSATATAPDDRMAVSTWINTTSTTFETLVRVTLLD